MMKITYICHSGFMAELENCCLLFDYYKGVIPKTNKKLYVFASHFHGDHYNPEIFGLRERGNVKFILSSDIKTKDKSKDIFSINSGENITVDDIDITTLKSTDEGVAFIVKCEGKTIYHAGDLNLWVWQEESKAYNNNMKANFMRYTKNLRGLSIDVGFLPLDPRQGIDYDKGIDAYRELADFKKIFPMHFWSRYDIIKKYKSEKDGAADNVVEISYEGQTWEV